MTAQKQSTAFAAVLGFFWKAMKEISLMLFKTRSRCLARTINCLITGALVLMAACFTLEAQAANQTKEGVVAPIPGEVNVRVNTFERADTDFGPLQLNTPFAASTVSLSTKDSTSTYQIVNKAGSRWLEILTPADRVGGLAIPFDNGWRAINAPQVTCDLSFLIKEKGSDLSFQVINGDWSMRAITIYIIGADGFIYARSNKDLKGAMAQRATWQLGKPFTIKLVSHLDTKCYDLYIKQDGITKQLVNAETLPLPFEGAYTSGLAAFLVSPPTLHPDSTFLVDNLKVSTAAVPGPMMVINHTPGNLKDSSIAIKPPVKYFVSPTGNDDNKGLSPESPFKTSKRAVNQTAPGDTVYFMGGLYTNTTGDLLLDITTSGVEGHPITYTNYDSHKPVFKETVPSWQTANIRASYIIVDGLKFEGRLDELTVKQGEEMYDYVLATKEAGNTDWSKVSNTNTNSMTIAGTPTDFIHHIVVRNCEVANISGGGFGSTQCDYFTYENNDIHDSGWTCMYATSGIMVNSISDYDTNYTDYKVIIRNNRIYRYQTRVKWDLVRRYSDGNGIIIDTNNMDTKEFRAYKGRFLIANNICYENGGSGIHSFQSDNVDIVNNTVYNNNQIMKEYSQVFAGSSANVRIINNIIGTVAGDLINHKPEDESVIYANNLYFGANVSYMGPGDRVGDPKFVNLDARDFHLAKGSDAIDQGVVTFAPTTDIEGNARPQGKGIDQGAYESAFTSPAPLANPTLDLAKLQASSYIYDASQAIYGTPVIDGEVDDLWKKADQVSTGKLSFGNLNLDDNATGSARILWDEKNLYVLAEVKDKIVSARNKAAYEKDSVEIYFDQNNGKTKGYQADDGQYRVDVDNVKTGGNGIDVNSFTSALKIIPGGYRAEIAIPFTKVTPTAGTSIGFDIQINSEDGTGKRISVRNWADISGQSWSSTSKWGIVKLVREREKE